MNDHYLSTCNGANGTRNLPLKAVGLAQYATISGNLLKFSLILCRKGRVLYSSGQSLSKQCDPSEMRKSAKVKQPNANSFSPTNALSCCSFGKNFSISLTLIVSQSLSKKVILVLSYTSLKIVMNASNLAESWIFLPSKPLLLPHLAMMYRLMAVDSVRLYYPSMRQGTLGKLRPRFTLSSLNHFSWWLQEQ